MNVIIEPKGKTKFNLKIIVLKIFDQTISVDQTNKNSERKQLQYVKVYFKYMHYTCIVEGTGGKCQIKTAQLQIEIKTNDFKNYDKYFIQTR